MTTREIAKYNMYLKLVVFFIKEASKFIGFKRLVDEITNFNSFIPPLTEAYNAQSSITTGITSDKAESFSKLVSTTVKLARKALVYAIDKKNNTLMAILNVRKDDFSLTNRNEAIARIQNIITELDAIVDKLADYRVTASNIADLKTQFTNYTKAAEAPATAKGNKAAANALVKGLIKNSDTSIKIIDDLLINEYKEDDLPLVTEYKTNRKIEVTGKRYTGITATFIDAASKLAIAKATIAVTNSTKKAISDANGKANIKSMRSGSYSFSFIAAGYTTQTQTLVIEKGKTLEVEILMEK